MNRKILNDESVYLYHKTVSELGYLVKINYKDYTVNRLKRKYIHCNKTLIKT